MIAFYLYEKLQCTPVIIIADNAKTHRNESLGRRQQFVRSHSEPAITSRNRLPTSTGNRSRNDFQPKRRPGMCRWNSFTQRLSSPKLVDEEKTSLACNLSANAPKPVRRGSWGKLGPFIPSRKPSLNGEMVLGRPPRPASQ